MLTLTYKVDALLCLYTKEIQTCDSADYQMLEHRIEVLEELQQCGIEETTLGQLNQIK